MERKVNFRDLELELTISQKNDWLIDFNNLSLGYGVEVETMKEILQSNISRNEKRKYIEEDSFGEKKMTKRVAIRIGSLLGSDRAEEFKTWAKNLKIDEDDIAEESNLIQDDNTSIKNQLATIMVDNEENQVKDGFQDELVKFTNKETGASIRTMLDENGEPLFCLKDLCDALELEQVSRVKMRISPEVTFSKVRYESGQGRSMTFVNEEGLYEVIFQSKKPEAKVFKKWVFSEVLPSIRKTGSYSSKQPIEDDAIIAAKGMIAANNIIQKQKLQLLEANNRIQAQKETIEELTPAAEKYKKWLDSDGLIDMAVTAQILNITYFDEISQKKKLLGRNTLFKFLKEFGVLKNNNTPYQSYVKYFEVKQTLCPDAVYRTKIFVRPEGVDFIEKILKKHLTSIAK